MDLWYNYTQKERSMKGKTLFMLFIFVCFSSIVFAQSAEDLIAQADELYNEMKDMETAQKALQLYQKALGVADDKYEAYWKMSRIQYYVGTHTENKKEKQVIFSQGVYNGKKAVSLQPEKPDGHYWLGVNNGKYGEVKGVMKSLSLVGPIKESMFKIIEVDRGYEDGGADRVLGRVFFKVPGIAGGSKDKSLEHLEKSKELGPEDPITRLYLAETYIAKDRVEDARAELDYIMNMPDDPRWVSGVEESKMEAQELLKKKEFRK
jgi:tetratricopeptide (TPR) repeat protein